MIDFITINPTQYREHCFDLEGFDCSRWEVDFYLINEHYDPEFDEDSDQHDVVSLQFTAYDLEQETPEQAYKFLQEALKVLVACYKIGNNYPSYGAVFSQQLEYDTIFSAELKQVLTFIKELLGINKSFNINNIDKLSTYVYLYYSSVKWLDYPFHSGCNDYTIFEDMEEFEKLVNGEYELKHYINANLY